MHEAINPKVLNTAERDLSVWVELTGYAFRYRIGSCGEVQRYYPTKNEWRNKKQHMCGSNVLGSQRAAVKMTLANGEHKTVFVVDLMAEAFMGGRKAHPGMVITHKNGLRMDCALCNLKWTTKSEIGKRQGGAGRKSIEKIDRDGNVVALYKSTTECCEHEFISRKSLWRRLKNQIPDPYRLTGYN